MKVALWDHAFAHCAYSVPGRVSKHIEWVRHQPAWDGITVITDNLLHADFLRGLKSRIKVGWLLEGRAYGHRNYARIPQVIDHLDLLMTHDAELLARYPAKARFVPFGGCWIPDDEWGMRPKSKILSMIYSAKNFMEGHRLRHELAVWLRNKKGAELFGYGAGRPIQSKTEGLADFLFSVVIENDRAPNYFTEKLIDCFALGTIPIYWGCPNIGDFFDTRGMLLFDDADTFRSSHILEHTQEMLEAAERNLITARKYVLPEDYMYEHVLKGLE